MRSHLQLGDVHDDLYGDDHVTPGVSSTPGMPSTPGGSQLNNKSEANAAGELSVDSVELISQVKLRKYLWFARSSVRLKLTNMDSDKVSCGGMLIALRYLELIVCLAEVHSLLQLREVVRDDGINAAIAIVPESFFAS